MDTYVKTKELEQDLTTLRVSYDDLIGRLDDIERRLDETVERIAQARSAAKAQIPTKAEEV